MNKILLDGDKIIFNKEIDSITVKGLAKLYINNMDEDFELNIDLEESSCLQVYDFSANSISKSLIINHTNNTRFEYFHTFRNVGVYNFKYRANLNGNNNVNNINILGISLGNALLDVDGKVIDKTVGNSLNENIRILTLGGVANVLPMMHISAKDVVANHNTAISNIREDELFYLMSKGIDENSAQKLIEDGYLYGYFRRCDEEFYNLIKEGEVES